MSLKIQKVKKDKVFDIGDGATLRYQYLKPLEQMRFMRSYTHLGKMTEDQSMQMSYDLMKKMVVGWKGIINEDDDKPIKFEKKLIEILPMPAIFNFITKIITPLFAGIGKGQKESNLEN